MSQEEFFYYGAPGIDDEPLLEHPNKLKIPKGLLLYHISEGKNSVEVFGFRKTPWIGKTKVRLVREDEKEDTKTNLLKHLDNKNYKITFWD